MTKHETRERQAAKQVLRRSRCDEAVRLRIAGLPYREIALRMGVSHGTAFKMVREELERVPVENVKQLRLLEGQRLDELWRLLMDQATMGHSQSARAAIRVHAARVSLYGLGSPAEADKGEPFED